MLPAKICNAANIWDIPTYSHNQILQDDQTFTGFSTAPGSRAQNFCEPTTWAQTHDHDLLAMANLELYDIYLDDFSCLLFTWSCITIVH